MPVQTIISDIDPLYLSILQSTRKGRQALKRRGIPTQPKTAYIRRRKAKTRGRGMGVKEIGCAHALYLDKYRDFGRGIKRWGKRATSKKRRRGVNSVARALMQKGDILTMEDIKR